MRVRGWKVPVAKPSAVGIETPGAAPAGDGGSRGWGKRLGRGLDVLAVLLIAFAVWKLFVAPRIFVEKEAAVPAPAVALPLLGGGTFEPARQRGHVVFLDFWATWCEPCKLSIPLIEHYKSVHPDAVVVSVDVGEPVALVSQFARQKKMKSVAFDPEMSAAGAFGVGVFPTMVVVDADGKVRAKWIGFNPLIETAMDNAARTFAKP